MAFSVSVSWNYWQIRVSDGSYNGYNQNISGGVDNNGNQTGFNKTSYNTNTDFDYLNRFVSMGSSTNLNSDVLVICSGGIVGAAYVPYPIPAQGTVLSGSFFSTYERNYDVTVRGVNDLPFGFDKLSENGEYYKDNDGNWRNVNNDNIVATAQQVSNLPNGVDFNGWLFDNEVIEGSDGNYYDLGGNQVFSNLPSGVIPTSQIINPVDDGSGNLSDGVFQGSDGNYYNIDGSQILGNLPVGVTPVSQIGDIFEGSNGSYYDIYGDEVMGNLPSGVSIVGYNESNNTYTGSDGKQYDINGDEYVEPSEPCSGIELQFTQNIRLTVDCIDIFGNQQNIGADIYIGQSALDFSTLFNFNYIRQINRITARSLENGCSVGNGILRIRGIVVGAKVAVDIEGVDVDAVLGNYEVCACHFSVCDRYSEPILNKDLPLGLAQHTDLDVGYFCLNQFLYFDWEGFSDTFPYCCPSYSESVKESSETPNPNEDKDMAKLIESIDKLTEAVEGLSTLVEVVVSPAEDVNIYNRRFHYNDRDNFSGFSE